MHTTSSKVIESMLESSFYQRGIVASYASAGIARAEMSVCPSVPFDTPWYCIKTNKPIVIISSQTESRNIRFIPKFKRDHTERGRFMRLGWVGPTNWWLSTYKPPFRRNGARAPMLLLITNRKSHTWLINSLSLSLSIVTKNHLLSLTLNWLWTAIMSSVTLHTWFRNPPRKF